MLFGNPGYNKDKTKIHWNLHRTALHYTYWWVFFSFH